MPKHPTVPPDLTDTASSKLDAHPASSPTVAGEADYEVGYARPPKETQFKPGKSGNPNGRPRKKNMQGSELIAHLMSKKIQLKETRVLPLELAFLATVKKAAAGDMRAAAMLLEFEKMAAASNTRRAGLFDPDQAQAALAAFVKRKSPSK